MRSEAQIALGIEAGSDGRAIGRDPRKMGPDELRLLGHMPMALELTRFGGHLSI